MSEKRSERTKLEPVNRGVKKTVTRGPRQPVTTNEAEIISAAMVRVGDAFAKAFDSFFRPVGLTDAQYNVMRILEGAGEPLPQQEIARRLIVSRSNITILLDKLEAHGFVRRESSEDRRVKLVYLTEKGLEFVEETFISKRDACVALLQPLTAAERKTLRPILEKLLNTLD